MNAQGFAEKMSLIKRELALEIIGQEDVIEQLLTAVVAGGNVLLEGVPGLGKTRLVRALGRALKLDFSRIQFTPDLMPADITGTNIIVKSDGGNRFEFKRGPLFASIVLADEINRATPKTQSALLEAMQEHTVTVAGETYAMPEPYFVLATQNPVEQEGTYPLPEAQMDRFMFKITVGFPTLDELSRIVAITTGATEERASGVADGRDILEMRALASSVPVASAVSEWAMRLIMNTHPELAQSPEISKKYLRFGASPRAAQALISASRVRAFTQGRFNVAFEDVRLVAHAALRHRLALNFEGISEGLDADSVIDALLREK